MEKWINKYIKYLNLLNKSEKTIDNYVTTLKKIVRDEDIKDINEFKDMNREWWFGWVREQRELGKTSIATINCKIKQMSSFYHFLVNEDIVKENCLYKFPKVNQTNGLEYKEKCMTDEQAKAILNATNSKEFNRFSDYINIRNKTIIYTLMSLAPRIEELSRIRIEDLDLENENRIFIRGKGRGGEISRFTNCNDKVKNMIIELVNYNPNRKFLFTNEKGEQLKTQGIRKVWYDTCNLAGVNGITVHMVRHYLRLVTS